MISGFSQRALAATLTAALALGACQQRAGHEGTASSASAAARELPPLAVRSDTKNLLLTWVDDQGDFHVVDKPTDVPDAARKTVRVVATDREDGTGDLVYVANLSETAPDGSYRLSTMTRAAWDEIGASRRKARLEALAPPSALPPEPGPAPSASGVRPPPSGVVAIIYGASWCKPCHDAEHYLRQRGLKVIKKDIEESEAAADEMRKKLERANMPGASIPVIDIMGRIMIGFSPSALDRAIELAQSAKPL